MGDMLVSMGALTGNRADIAASAAELGDAFSRPYVEAISTGRAVAAPTLLHQTEVDQAMRAAIEKAWAGTLTPGAALAQAETGRSRRSWLMSRKPRRFPRAPWLFLAPALVGGVLFYAVPAAMSLRPLLHGLEPAFRAALVGPAQLPLSA